MKMAKVHEDKRGEIHVISGLLRNDLELTIHRTNKGFARGGYIHPATDEWLAVIEGKLMNLVDGDDIEILYDGDTTLIPHGESHMYVALEDSISMEWGVPLEEKMGGHGEWRKIVDEVNK